MKNFNKIYNNILSKTNNIIHESNIGNQPQPQPQTPSIQTPQQPQQPQQNINQQQPTNQLSDEQIEQIEQELKNVLLSSSEYKDLIINIEAYIKKGDSSL